MIPAIVMNTYHTFVTRFGMFSTDRVSTRCKNPDTDGWRSVLTSVLESNVHDRLVVVGGVTTVTRNIYVLKSGNVFGRGNNTHGCIHDATVEPNTAIRKHN